MSIFMLFIVQHYLGVFKNLGLDLRMIVIVVLLLEVLTEAVTRPEFSLPMNSNDFSSETQKH